MKTNTLQEAVKAITAGEPAAVHTPTREDAAALFSLVTAYQFPSGATVTTTLNMWDHYRENQHYYFNIMESNIVQVGNGTAGHPHGLEVFEL